jgi:arylsulfatase A-like enzyme
VILDTVRADHLSSYGYSRPTTPNLDRLAADGERYEEAFAQSSWTLPAVATILTGQPPHVHGADRWDGALYPVRRDVPTLAERLRDAGFRTGGVFNVVWCGPDSGLGRGFEWYDHVVTDASNRNHRTAAATTDLALGWLAQHREAPRLFLVVHYFDPHLTYDPPPPFDTRYEPPGGGRIRSGFGSTGEVARVRSGEIQLGAEERQSLVARYDGELSYVDREFGRLRQGMERLGLWDTTLVIVVADHGEEFWDHGSFEHGHSHFRELLRVPLIVRRPDGATPPGRVVHDRVRQLDIAPTVLDHARVGPVSGLPGRILGRGGAAYAVAEGGFWSDDLVSVRSDEGTLIVSRTTSTGAYFGPDDVLERRRQSLELAERTRLAGILRALPPRAPGEQPWEPTEEQLRQLRSLGYIR